MPGDKYEKYGRPEAPAATDQEFMTVQETAWVLGCSVPTVRRRLTALGITSKPGRRVMTSRADRLALHEAGRVVQRKAVGRPRIRAAA
ncbi:DNA-binding protein [Streptomyces sp. NPDC057539]|uniref:DNA-binding protein n=1 Tax=unclassified Streptomyces TaxID=2593676 RepID=UPI0036AF8F62